jgi:hypothetical protein
MANWTKETLRLKERHGWRARTGFKIFVADRGAVRFDIPQDWVMVPGPDSFEFRDRPQPDDDCLLQLSLMRLNPQIDWSGLPVATMLEEVLAADERRILSRGETIKEARPAFELAWTELRVIDPGELREACSRACLARGGSVQPLITMDFWPEHSGRFCPVWDEVLRTLQLGAYIEDPTRGPLLH